MQLDVPKFAQFPATHHDCSKQSNVRQFNLTRVLKSTQILLKPNILGQLLLYVFVLKRKDLQLFADLQLFKKHGSFVVKVLMTKTIDMIVWIGVLIHCQYLNNWIPMRVQKNPKFQ